MSNCDCALRSFWDGPCSEHATEYAITHDGPAKFSDYGAAVDIERNKAIDPMVEQAAKELAFKAGEEIDKAFEFLQTPPIPAEALKFIEDAQKANERASGYVQKEHNIHRTT